MEESYLKECKACGTEISRYSPFCRNCGHPQGSVVALWLLGFFLIMLVAFYLALMIYCMCNVESMREDGQPPRGQQQQVETPVWARLPSIPGARSE